MQELIIKGAKENNLKNVDLIIPKNKLVVFVGINGSGKSSMAFTIYQESRSKYINCLSFGERRFIRGFKKPNVESIIGSCPTVYINQKSINKNPKSTVGTITHIYDYLRMLFSQISVPHCYICQAPLYAFTVEEIANELMLNIAIGTKFYVTSPLKSQPTQSIFTELKKNGYTRVFINGTLYNLNDDVIDENTNKDIFVVIDRLIMANEIKPRLIEACEAAFLYGNCITIISDKRVFHFSKTNYCAHCKIKIERPNFKDFSFNSNGACPECSGAGKFDASLCTLCGDSRLRSDILNFKIEKKNISELSYLSIDELFAFFDNLMLNDKTLKKCGNLLNEIKNQLKLLIKIGVGNLSLSQSANTLSYGQIQRINIACQIRIGISGILYIFKNPCQGLYEDEKTKIINMIRELIKEGNSVIAIEHDRDFILKTDLVIEFGPGVGANGGEIMATRAPGEINQRTVLIKAGIKTKKLAKKFIKIENVFEDESENIDIKIPFGALTSIIINKSCLDKIKKFIVNKLKENKPKINKIVFIEQMPLSYTKKSTIATLTGIFSEIRSILAKSPEARMKAYANSRFNSKSETGQCADCEGRGVVKRISFLSDDAVLCEACGGTGYDSQTLNVHYKNKNIYEILQMSCDEALAFFRNFPKLKRVFSFFCDLGFGYIKIGQNLGTLSCGEHQIIKLASCFSKNVISKAFYIIDGLTTGIHPQNLNILLRMLHNLINIGNTILLFDHNLDVIASSDYVIDLNVLDNKKTQKTILLKRPKEICSVFEFSHREIS